MYRVQLPPEWLVVANDAAGMNSEHTSKQCGGNLLGQLIERCQPSALRFDSECAESVSQRGGADMSSGAVAWEQPQGGQLLGYAVAPSLG
jgi:hypothetical protein